jgi:hypothetical protein
MVHESTIIYLKDMGLDTFVKSQEAPMKFVMPVCLSVRPSVRPSVLSSVSKLHLVPTEPIFMKFIMETSMKICRENSIFFLNRTKITGSLHLSKFILLKAVRNI